MGSRPARSSRVSVDAAFGVALVDRLGNLLGASASAGLPGEVAVPPGTNLREHDLRPYCETALCSAGARSFPLVSATWVQVKSRKVRVGIYMEKGDPCVSAESLDLDLGAVAALLSAQLVA